MPLVTDRVAFLPSQKRLYGLEALPVSMKLSVAWNILVLYNME